MKIRINFVSNSSSASFIVNLDEYESVLDLAKHMIKMVIAEEKERKNGEDWVKKFEETSKKLDEAKKKGLDPNTNIFLPTYNYETLIIRKQDAYYIDSCHNFNFNDFKYISKSESLHELDENNFFYYPELDVMAKPVYTDDIYCEKCDEEKLMLEDGTLFCPICEKDKIDKYKILDKKKK